METEVRPMKRKIAFLLALLMAASVLAGCGGSKTWTGKHEVEITVNNYGTIRLEVDAVRCGSSGSGWVVPISSSWTWKVSQPVGAKRSTMAP